MDHDAFHRAADAIGLHHHGQDAELRASLKRIEARLEKIEQMLAETAQKDDARTEALPAFPLGALIPPSIIR